MLLKVRHPHICFLISIQTAKEPYQLIILFYHVNGVSLSVYETRSLPAKLSDTKIHALDLVRPSLTLEVWLTITKNLAEALHFGLFIMI